MHFANLILLIIASALLSTTIAHPAQRPSQVTLPSFKVGFPQDPELPPAPYLPPIGALPALPPHPALPPIGALQAHPPHPDLPPIGALLAHPPHPDLPPIGALQAHPPHPALPPIPADGVKPNKRRRYRPYDGPTRSTARQIPTCPTPNLEIRLSGPAKDELEHAGDRLIYYENLVREHVRNSHDLQEACVAMIMRVPKPQIDVNLYRDLRTRNGQIMAESTWHRRKIQGTNADGTHPIYPPGFGPLAQSRDP